MDWSKLFRNKKLVVAVGAIVAAGLASIVAPELVVDLFEALGDALAEQPAAEAVESGQ